jgi:two-component system, OmpR family, response regulator
MTVKPNLAFVIEDDATFADTCERALRSAGFEVETFFDGRTAYDRLAVEPAPRLVLLDMHLPEVSGNEITWELWFNLQDSSIIIITADTEMAGIYQNKEGVDNVLIKPIPLDVLKDLVKPYLSPVR